MSVFTKASLAAVIVSSAASAQTSLLNVVAVQQARIDALENQLKEDVCGTYGQVVFNSVANLKGTQATGDQNTRTFWNIPYVERFKTKGQLTRNLSKNYYNGDLYRKGPAVYTDVFEDLSGKIITILRAQADGIDERTMHFINPKLIGGNELSYTHQFASGWSSSDQDFDSHGTLNCATSYGNVTQHYGTCWIYNLGVDAEGSNLDEDWGPHINSDVLAPAGSGVQTDKTLYTRVSRVTRCAKPM
ncbi:MAG TPA: hypothetical protein VE954_34915 [Oligoflexus sp.]|uniref:hypothetical protein n=1 Tax=Oligoflexus sp. TaxID=1971216 RepID=UPI002D316384|nr:hypothetical protein [Oligoflexus sp.]HYX38323.1 hypothetical protein [Oligoflexus sp.]